METAEFATSNNSEARVIRLWRYPVKSMLGEKCGHLTVDKRGAKGDRLFAVRDADGKFGSGKTTRRFRKIDGLFGFRAVYEHETPRITFPDGREILGNDSSIHTALSDALGQPVTLARERGISHLDSGPLHLIATASLAWLNQLLPDSRVDDRRFRPNILIELPGMTQLERLWLGKTLRIGEVILQVDDLTERCVMVNFPQDDLPNDPRILRSLGRDIGPHFGVYASVRAPGTIKLNDRVFVVT
ncbi:MOSC domain-containing protein [Synechococcus sp. CCY 9618]|uniref:MOSC domain-containing protein n=1 Tax=Synechococcus sp. CCY 9618 TaxID=2815602 RepID=UPI001C221F78|nr:MOSC domain-containing protein [Synechococcus sp. CCY 9618]